VGTKDGDEEGIKDGKDDTVVGWLDWKKEVSAM
jgi:hypothetical protein